MADPYDLAQKHLKETLKTQYAENHPETPKEQVGTTEGTGKEVFTYLGEAFGNIKKQDRAPGELDDHGELDRILVLNSDQRYQACLASLNTSKRIIHDLFKSQYSEFAAADRDRHLAQLRKEDNRCEKSTLLQHRTQNNFLKMMDRTKRATRKSGYVFASIYFQSVLEQLKAQHAVYKHEGELEEQFRLYAKKLIRSQFKKLRGAADVETLETLAETYSVLKNERQYSAESVRDLNYQALEHALSEMEHRLEKQRKELGVLEAAIAIVEQMVGSLENVAEAQPEPAEIQDETPIEETETKESKRMARFSKVRLKSKISRRR